MPKRFYPSIQEKLVATDNALGHLELAAMHVRNQFRELVGSDDPAVNAELVSNIRIVLAECVRIGKTLHGDFRGVR